MADLDKLDLENATGGTWVPHPPKCKITGAHFDSRELGPGELFISIGVGHCFIERAIQRGASAAIVTELQQQFDIPQLLVKDSIVAFQRIAQAYRQTLKTEIIAIAGSFGKTTTKDLLALLLGNSTYKTIGNQNSQLGVPLNVLKISSPLHRYAVIEVGIETPGDMQKQTEVVRAKHVIFTGISNKHMEFFTEQDELLKEKLHIAKYIDSQNGKLIISKELSKHCAFDGLHSILLCAENHSKNFSLPSMSIGFAKAFILCHCMCNHLGISSKDIQDRLLKWEAPSLREQIFKHKANNQIYYVDCYNSDFEPLIDSIKTFSLLFYREKRLFVIGEMSGLGHASCEIHKNVGDMLPIDDNNQFIFIGNDAIPMQIAMRRRGFQENSMQFFQEKNNELLDAVTNFRGAIYLKSSRKHALETLIDFDNCIRIA
jgi:UDP-N-acetylmuramyl pentapeptide synthase